MFGQNNSNSVFGQSAGFGQPAQQQQSGSLFGNTQTPQQSGSLFGNTQQQQPGQTTSGFGFGSTNLGFGQPATSTQQTTGFSTGFGSTNTGFGTTNTGFGSGSGLFNTSNTGTNAFGTQQQLNNNTSLTSGGFAGLTTGASSFGATTQGTLGTTIKFTPQTASDNLVKNGQQVNITIRLNCITCMPQYESKSIEELRIEDYAANRKGPTTPASGSLFGNTTTLGNAGSSLFNQTSTANTGFGASTNTGIFGSTQNKPTAFGSISQPVSNTNTSLFGSNTLNQQKSSFGFGATNTTSAFGQPAQQQQSVSLFGNTQTPQQSGSLFGNTQTQQQSGSLFGNTQQPQQTSLFGSTQPQQTGQTTTGFGGGFGSTSTAFGQPATNTQQATGFGSTFGSTSGGFGAVNTSTNTGLFGSAQNKPGFDSISQPASNTNTVMFGSNNLNQQKSSFGFGTNTTSAFGQPAQQQQTGSLFGNTQTQPQTGGSLFGNTQTQPQTGGSLFGNTQTQQTGQTNTGFGGGFGSTNTAFGQPATNTQQTTGFGNTFGSTSTGFGSTNAFGTPSSLFGSTNTPNLFGNTNNQQPFQQQVSAQPPLANTINTQQILARFENLPYGLLPQLSVDLSFQTNTIKTKFTTNPKTLNQYKIDAKSAQKSPGIMRIPNSVKPASMLFDGLDDENVDSTKSANDIFSPRTSVKKLVLNKKADMSLTPASMKLLFSPRVNKFQNLSPLDSTPKRESTRIGEIVSPVNARTTPKSVHFNDTMAEIRQFDNDQRNQSISSPASQNQSANGSLDVTFGFGPNQSGDDSLVFGADETDQYCSLPNCGIVLTRQEYYTIPSIEECDELYKPETDTCVVDNFTVGRTGYGSIFWNGPLDVKGLNLDEIVHIRRKETIVYPDDDEKPPLGQGLNRPAQITLESVWPINKSSRMPIKDPEVLAKYTEKLEAATLKLDATFKEYRPETGAWVFTVKHFSKYGLEDDDEDVEMVPQNLNTAENNNKNVKLPLKTFPKEFNQETFASKIGSLDSVKQPKNVLREVNGLSTDTYAGGDQFNGGAVNGENGFLHKSPEKKSAEIELMQNVLFDDAGEEEEDELLNSSNVVKKAKSSSFNKSQTVITKVFPATPLIPASLRASNVKKRELRFNPLFEKAEAHVNSLHMAPCTRVQFLNGSNKFCYVSGKSVLIMDCDIAKMETPANIELIREHLHGELLVKPSIPVIPEQRKCPGFSLSPGMSRSMTDLIEALFGKLNEQLPYSKYQERLQKIKNWLVNYNKQLEVPGNGPWIRILHFLTTNEISFAVTECQRTRNHRLGFLIASSASKDRSEKLLTMLDMWKMSTYDTKINADLLKIYALLAGTFEWKTSDGKTVRVLEGLHWTQQLLLILLYCEEPIHESDLFIKERDHESDTFKNPLTFAISKMLNEPNDVEFHLLAQHSPWIALSCSDAFLTVDAFFLHETLASYDVITQDWKYSLSDSIYLYMASQINDLRWSIYFVVHVSKELVRYRFVVDLLMKNAKQLFDASVETFLIDNFHIDQKLILEAKLVYSKQNCEPKITAQLLLDSGAFVQAHKLLVNECFHELVINEEHEELQNMIDLLSPYQDRLVSTWQTSGAGVFQTYLELCRFDKDREQDREKAPKLLEQFDGHQLKLENKRQFLSQNLMSTVANLVRHAIHESLDAVQPKSDFFDSRMLTMIQTRLAAYRRQFPLNNRIKV